MKVPTENILACWEQYVSAVDRGDAKMAEDYWFRYFALVKREEENRKAQEKDNGNSNRKP